MKILVPGGAGYVGSHCCKVLAKSGYSPVIFDNLSTGHAALAGDIPVVEGSLNDRDALKTVMEAHDFSGVMHFAAASLVGESVRDPGRYWRNNVCGTLNLLEAMRDAGIRALVFSSTAAVYGEPDIVPIPEDAPKRPVNPYGQTKLACETMMDDFSTAHDLRSIRLRYFNAAGADPAAEIGEDHDPETHLIPLVLDAALGRRKDIGIFGRDYATQDGTAVRDYVHVEDLGHAHIAAMEHLLDGGDTMGINLGTGQGASVLEVIETARRVTGRPINAADRERRAGDPPVLVANADLAGSVLGWKPKRSDLETITADAWRWHEKRFG